VVFFEPCERAIIPASKEKQQLTIPRVSDVEFIDGFRESISIIRMKNRKQMPHANHQTFGELPELPIAVPLTSTCATNNGSGISVL
jgi:hypothetical protein